MVILTLETEVFFENTLPSMIYKDHRLFRTISEHAYTCSIVVLISLSSRALFKLKVASQMPLIGLQMKTLYINLRLKE